MSQLTSTTGVNTDVTKTGTKTSSDATISKPQENTDASEGLGMQLDLYNVLDLQHTASHEEVELAFKKKASECFPDKNCTDRSKIQKKFNEVTYAYSILSDPSRRDDYDQIKHYHFTKEQALQTFNQFYKTYGVLPNEEQFFRRYCPDRKRTYYDLLDVPKNASDKLIHESFKKKAVDCHPLNFPGDKNKEEAFRQLCEAYHHLSDRYRRRIYDKIQFRDAPTFQAHAQFNNYFKDNSQFENENDRKVLGDFVRKTSAREEPNTISQHDDNLKQDDIMEELSSHTYSSKGPQGETKKTIVKKISTKNGKTIDMDTQETVNPDGSVDIIETIRDSTGKPHTNKYSVQTGANRPVIIQQ